MTNVYPISPPQPGQVLDQASEQKRVLNLLITHYLGMVHADLDDALWPTPHRHNTHLTFEELKRFPMGTTFWADFQRVLTKNGIAVESIGDIINFFHWEESDIEPLRGREGRIETGTILLALEHLNMHLYSGG